MMYGKSLNYFNLMNRNELLNIIASVNDELKDFQRATVENVFRKLYSERQRRHLVADEVGLGKTIVAKGLIAKAMERHLKSSRQDEPFKVVYICSNQALTSQNLKKLNIFKQKEFLETDKGRLIFQAFKPKNKEVFQVSSLTPSTSFRLIKGTGVAEERQLIWMILAKYDVFNRGKRYNGMKLVMLGNIAPNYIEWWKNNCDKYYSDNINRVRPEVFSLFKKSVAETLINLNDYYFKPIKDELGWSCELSMQEVLIAYSEKLRVDNVKKHEGQKRLLGALRKLLTEVCLDFIDADLFILDEFQKFKDLIATDTEKVSEASAIAQKVFKMPKAKVLLLSATPFKPYTTKIDADFDEDHHQEFKDVLSFLFNKKPEKLEEYEQNRKVFFELLRRPENIAGSALKEKDKLQELYREVLSRTERLLVSDDKNTLLKNTTLLVGLLKEDIINFIETDKIVQALNEALKKGNQALVDFSKSAPFPLSFMDQYKVKEDLKKLSRKDNTLKRAIINNQHAWLDLNRIQSYKSIGEIPNGNMRELMNQSLSDGLWKQLWLAPSLPYYKSEGSFKDAVGNSKVLVFSKWRMVPRAIASIISYESERLSIGSHKLKISGKQYMPDINPNQKKKKRFPRKPGKLLALKLKEDKPSTMPVFTLVYPSQTLATQYSLQVNAKLQTPKTLNEIKKEVELKLSALIKQSDLTQHCTLAKQTRNWYWAAPLLLDKYFHPDIYDKWINEGGYKTAAFLSSKNSKLNSDNEGEEEAVDNKAAMAHFNVLQNGYTNTAEFELGEFPDDLLEVLALQVIGSPAVTSLRMLLEVFPEVDSNLLLNSALDIGSQFHSLFDKPESIAVVRLASIEKGKNAVDGSYWMEVLDYCVDGNLQSVLDEFAHLIAADYNSISEFIKRMGNAVSIRTSNLNVDSADSFLKRNGSESLQMRCHYAVDFGNQNMDKEEGINRVKSILDNFNSPFRPFVLASTSIGQEGLDFHYYCRKVMHWNLPTNPIDIEQREGRVNRFKGLVVRQNLVKKYSKELNSCHKNLWEYLFDYAEYKEGKQMDKCQLVPYWHIEADGINIERIIPLIPFSREVSKLEKLLVTLTLYRLTFGQPRQEELVEALYKEHEKDILAIVREKLIINLCPITYNT